MVPEQYDLALPQINLQRCISCGLCAELCPNQAVEMLGSKPVIVRPADCTYCDVCERYCPVEAIERPFMIAFAPKIAPG